MIHLGDFAREAVKDGAFYGTSGKLWITPTVIFCSLLLVIFSMLLQINNFWFASPLLLVVFLVLGLIGGASTGIGGIKNISGR